MIIEPFQIQVNRSPQVDHYFYGAGLVAATLVRMDHDLVQENPLAPTVAYWNGSAWTPITKRAEGDATAGWYFAEADKDVAYSLEAGYNVYRGIRFNAAVMTTIGSAWLKVTYTAMGDYIETTDLWAPDNRRYIVNEASGIPKLRVLVVKNGDPVDNVTLFSKSDFTAQVVGVSINPENVNRPLGYPIDVKVTGVLGGFTGLTPNMKVFATNSGLLTQNESSILNNERKFQIGYAISATEIDISLREAVQGAGSGLNAQYLQGYTPDLLILGKNKLINGDFRFWQRGASLAVSTGQAKYLADRWRLDLAGTSAAATYSRQAFTLGQTDIPGEPKYFGRIALTNGGDATNGKAHLSQYIEDVRNLAGRKATLSFWAKADAAKTVALELVQTFGAGGSPSADAQVFIQKVSLTTAWQKFTVTFDVPSITGKTIGSDGDHKSALQLLFWMSAGSTFNGRTSSLGTQTGTFDFAMAQIEQGLLATSFEQRPDGLELMLCQRYFEAVSQRGWYFGAGVGSNTSQNVGVQFKVRKRVSPSISDTGSNYYSGGSGTPWPSPSYISISEESAFLTGGPFTTFSGVAIISCAADAEF